MVTVGHRPNANRDTLLSFVQATITPGAIVHTGGWSGYGYLKKAGYDPAQSTSTTGSRTAS